MIADVVGMIADVLRRSWLHMFVVSMVADVVSMISDVSAKMIMLVIIIAVVVSMIAGGIRKHDGRCGYHVC